MLNIMNWKKGERANRSRRLLVLFDKSSNEDQSEK